MNQRIRFYRLSGIVFSFILLFSITGCVAPETIPDEGIGGISPPVTTEPASGKSQSVPDRMPDDKKPRIDPSEPAHLGQVRLDLSAVLQALFYRLKGAHSTDTGLVAFAPEVRTLGNTIPIDLAPFVLRQISIRKDEASGDDPFHRRVQALYKLEDSIGRQLFVAVAADYLIGDAVLYVRQAAAAIQTPAYSDIRFMVLPSNRLPALKYLKDLPFDELFRLSAENALSREQLKAVRPGSELSCKLIAFNMARTSTDGSLGIYTSGDAAEGRVSVKESISLNKNGWTVALVDGDFQLNSDPGFWFFVGLNEGGGSDTTKILARYNSAIVP